MIKTVTVINHLGDVLKMELKRPETSGFYVQRIEGLGPVNATINIVERAIMDGASYNSARVGSRNIVMYLGFLSAGDIEEIRHKSYKYFPLKKRITIQIETDTRICETYGYVESNEPDIFSDGETTQISVICPDSYFYDAGPNSINIVNFNGTEPMFSFEFSNESLTEELLVFGEFINTPKKSIIYTGDVEVGISIHIRAMSGVSDITIYNETTGEEMVIKTDLLKIMLNSDAGIISGDDIIITTSRGEKSITLVRSGESYNIINCLKRYPDWFQLTPGINVFAYSAEKGEESIILSIEHKVAYEGV